LYLASQSLLELNCSFMESLKSVGFLHSSCESMIALFSQFAIGVFIWYIWRGPSGPFSRHLFICTNLNDNWGMIRYSGELVVNIYYIFDEVMHNQAVINPSFEILAWSPVPIPSPRETFHFWVDISEGIKVLIILYPGAILDPNVWDLLRPLMLVQEIFRLCFLVSMLILSIEVNNRELAL